MSKILNTLLAAAGTTLKAGEQPLDAVKRIMPAISELDDASWDALPVEAQDYFNSAGDAVNARKPLPELPDYVAPAPAPAAGRRRSSAAAPAAPAVPQKGDMVVITTKRGKTMEVEYVELDGNVHVFINEAGNEDEIAVDRVESIVVKAAPAPAAEPEPEVSAPGEPKVGDDVVATTKRGKVIEGKLVEIDGDLYVVETADGKEEELEQSRLTSIVVKAAPAPAASGRRGRGAATAAEQPAATGRRRGAAAAAPAEEPARATKEVNNGVSVTTRIRQLVAADLNATAEAIGAQMKKEGLTFRDNTLALTFAEAHKVVAILREAGRLK